MFKRLLQTTPLQSWLWFILGVWMIGHGTAKLVGGNTHWLQYVRVAGGLCLVGMEVRNWLRRRSQLVQAMRSQQDGRQEPEGDDEPLRSLVFMLDEPRKIEAGAWVNHLSEALGVPLNADGEQSRTFVMPMPHPVLTPRGDDCFMLMIPQGAFWIFHVKSPYMDDLEGWAAKVRDKRLREAVAGHTAWISVDLLKWMDGPPDPRRVYGVIGKCLAALAGPDVRAVFCPELQRCNEFDPSLLPALSSGDPLSLFENPTFAAVLQVKDDDEQMEAAVAEARARWPEFCKLFQRRDPSSDRPFIVKAPFTEDGNTEFMWMTVTGIEGDLIHGQLANQPHHLESYHEGQRVTVKLDDLNDWLCAGPDDKPLGGWTQRVILQRNSGGRRTG